MHAPRSPAHPWLLWRADTMRHVLLSISGASVVIWQLAKHKPRHQPTSAPLRRATMHMAEKSVIAKLVHELRQIFIALLLGLGLMKRKANHGNTQAIPDLIQRLNAVVRQGIAAVATLESSGSPDG